MTLDWRSMALGSLAGALGATALYAAQPAALPGAAGRAAIEAVVREYILAHPEIVPEALERAQLNAVAARVAERRAELERPFAGAVAGNPKGDVTLVEFFDYACGYCRTSVKDVDRLLAEDKGLRVVFRELPILSPASEDAARASMAAASAGGFLAFHRAMYAAGRVDAGRIAQARKAAGTPAAPARDAGQDAEIARNVELAQSLRLTGTPSFIVGGKVLNGAVGYERLKEAVAEARKKG